MKERTGEVSCFEHALQMRKVAGTAPAIGWTGQVRLNDDHCARLRAYQLPKRYEEV